MRDSVRRSFFEFSARFEGCVPWMYLDIKGLVTTGVGNLIDPVGTAVNLPFVGPNGQATPAEISAEWQFVKNMQDKAKFGGGWFKNVTKLRLGPGAIETLVDGKLTYVESVLKNRYPNLDNWPADAQMGLFSMAWAMGPGFHFPKFEAAVNKEDWTACTNECHMDDSQNPGLRPRNTANMKLFQNAARVKAFSLDPNKLYYPNDAFI